MSVLQKQCKSFASFFNVHFIPCHSCYAFSALSLLLYYSRLLRVCVCVSQLSKIHFLFSLRCFWVRGWRRNVCFLSPLSDFSVVLFISLHYFVSTFGKCYFKNFSVIRFHFWVFLIKMRYVFTSRVRESLIMFRESRNCEFLKNSDIL